MPTTKSITLPFDVTDCRRHFRRIIARQALQRQERSRRARQARQPLPPRSPDDGAAWLRICAGDNPLSASNAMRWLHLSPTPFYLWRQRLDIHPIVKKNHQALYARTDLLRLHAAYLAHRHTEETPYVSP